MLFLANWGSKQLAYRFPNGAINEATLQTYFYGVEEIELRKAGDYLASILSFTMRVATELRKRVT